MRTRVKKGFYIAFGSFTLILGFTPLLWHSFSQSPSFINLPGLLIVLFGTPLVLLASQHRQEVKRLMLSFSYRQRGKNDSYYSEINQLLTIANHFRCGRLRLAEQETSHINNDFVRFGVQHVIDGESLNEVHRLLDLRKAVIKERELADIHILQACAKFALTLGILGTVFSLIFSLHSVSMAAQNSITNAIGYSLLATLYGLIVSQILVKPLVIKKQRQLAQLTVHLAMFTEAITLIYQRQHPALIKDKLDAFMSIGVKNTLCAKNEILIESHTIS